MRLRKRRITAACTLVATSFSATDYPHSDSMFPNAVDIFLKLDAVSDEDKRKILWDNPARIFGISP